MDTETEAVGLPFDFSCKHDIWIHNPDGSLQRMDEPYFQAEQIAEGTWLVRSDGDFSYVLEGDNEALVIDSGYGCGDIRAFCQTLTEKPIYNIANTHHHFDHTANNGRFDCAYMSADTYPLATVPFPSFEGINFPKDYPVKLIGDGDTIELGNRTLEVLEVPDHAEGSLIYLDRRTRILFSGDEFMSMGKSLNGSVAHWAACLEKMKPWKGSFDVMYGGTGRLEIDVLDKMWAGCQRILAGEEGTRDVAAGPARTYVPDPEGLGRVIVERFLPRPSDAKRRVIPDTRRVLVQDGYPITYDIGHIYD